MSAARPLYGGAGIAAASEQPRAGSPLIPLLILFMALAAATAWYVAIPAFAKEPQARRTCEVVVLESGTTKCVKAPASRTLVRKANRAKR